MKEGWEIKKLGEVSQILNGGTPKSKVKEYWNGNINWITPADLGKLNSVLVSETPRKITELGLQKSSAKVFPENSIILSTRAPIGHLAINNVPMSTNQGCRGIVPSETLDVWYLYYFLKMNVELLDGLGTGATFKELSTKALAGVEIPLPPLPEQQRIVSILDECFAAIDKAKANAEQNLKNAKELFESYLQGVFEDGNWSFVKLSEMASDITDGDHMPPPKSDLGLPFITISNINKQTHKIDFTNTFKVPQSYYDDLKQKRKPFKGDVLYTVTGSYGIPVLIEDDFQFCFQRHIGLIRPSNKLNSKLLYYWILSPQAFLQANETATGTAQKTVSLKSLRNFRFPDIPIKEQQNIVHQLDSLRAETEKLESVYKKKINDLEELKKSVLQKAFAGELETEKEVAV